MNIDRAEKESAHSISATFSTKLRGAYAAKRARESSLGTLGPRATYVGGC